MKIADIKPGMLVVLRDNIDAKVYFVQEVSDPEYAPEVKIAYWLLDGNIAYTGPVHYSLLLPATRMQLLNRVDELDEWYDAHPQYEETACDAPVWEEYKTITSAFAEVRFQS